VKKIGGIAYLVFVLLSVVVLAWQLFYYKLTPQTADYQLVTLLPTASTASWQAEDSLTLSESRQQLDDQLSAQAYLLIELDSRTVILGKNLDTTLPPASTTKLMTALVALDLYQLDEVVTVSPEVARDNNAIGLLANEQLTVRNLLIATLVSSANDAAYALAEYAPGGLPFFIGQMNQRAEQWGLDRTHFENPTGYDDPPNVSTARDLSVLVMKALEEPMLVEWLSLPAYRITNITGRVPHLLETTNQMLGVDPRVIGGKTGTTALAREVLVTLAEHNQRQYLIIVMNTENRYGDTERLLNWLGTNVGWQPGADF